jgi:hypothetical protein
MTSTLKVDTIQGKSTAGTVAMPAGHIIQTVSTQYSGAAQSSTSASFVALTNLSVSITPKFSTSKMLIMTDPSIYMAGGQQDNTSRIAIYRDGSEVMKHTNRQYDYGSSGVLLERPFTMLYIDSPSTTSSVTYQVYMTLVSTASGHNIIFNDNANDTSSLIVQEIKQ